MVSSEYVLSGLRPANCGEFTRRALGNRRPGTDGSPRTRRRSADRPSRRWFSAGVWERFQGLADDLGAALADTDHGTLLQSGLDVAIVGPPNVGKSTLSAN